MLLRLIQLLTEPTQSGGTVLDPFHATAEEFTCKIAAICLDYDY